MSERLVGALVEAVGARDVLVDDDVRAPFQTDWTGRFSGRALAVVRPGSVDEVAAVVRLCAGFGVAVVPQGGNTGMVGAGVPRDGEVVLSLRRLRALGEIDTATLQVTAEAGVTLAELQAHALTAELEAGVDFGGRDGATVGGMVATDAGGLHAVRYGTVRARVAGLQAVLADGSVVDRRAGLLKDNAGYDLTALLVGSEGTLGVVTSVRWRLVVPPPARVAALVPLPSVEAAVALVARIRPRLPSLVAVELFLDDGLSLVLDHLGVPSPVARRAPAYVLIECASVDELAAAGLDEALVADESSERARLWRLREAHAEAIQALGIPHKLDVGVPLARLAEFVTRVREDVSRTAPGAQVIVFGHLGDGNVHVNVVGPPPDDDRVDEAVLRLAAACGGTISAEHGVGVAKARYLGLVRSEADLRAMRAVKRALDPEGVLNPGVVLPAP